MAAKTFVGAMLTFFGRKEGQSAGGFSGELKALTNEDKMEFAAMLRTQPGYEETGDPTPTLSKL